MLTYYAHLGAVDGNDVLDGNVALSLIQAVTTRLVKGAKGFSEEAGDVELSTQRVVLKDLVRGGAGTTTNDTKLGVETLGC